ncbi:MAG: FeoA family protein [Lachnospiraceae bacterium]
MLQLNKARNGQKVRIAAINGDSRFISRITSIGLTVDCNVEIINSSKNCPILLYARDTMIALGNQECSQIMMEVDE